jgi:hypothetical protein
MVSTSSPSFTGALIRRRNFFRWNSNDRQLRNGVLTVRDNRPLSYPRACQTGIVLSGLSLDIDDAFTLDDDRVVAKVRMDPRESL